MERAWNSLALGLPWNKCLPVEENVLLRTDSASIDAANLHMQIQHLGLGTERRLSLTSRLSREAEAPPEKVHEEKTFIMVCPALWKNLLKFLPLRVGAIPHSLFFTFFFHCGRIYITQNLPC